MQSLKAILRSIEVTLAKPLSDLVDVSLSLESPRTDDSASDYSSIGPSPEIHTASSTPDEQESDSREHSQYLEAEEGASNDLASGSTTAVADPILDEQPNGGTSSNGSSIATKSLNEGNSEHVSSDDIDRDYRDPGGHIDPAHSANGIEIGTRLKSAIDARKAYKTVSMSHRSSAILGDVTVHVNDRQTDAQIIRFEDCLGRRYQIPYEKYRKWPQMQMLIHQAFLKMDLFMPHIMQGRYHLTGPDREIIMPDYWDSAISPGMMVSMKMWSSPDLELAAEATMPIDFKTIGAARFDSGSLSLFSYPGMPKIQKTYEASKEVPDNKDYRTLRAEGNAAFTDEDYLAAIAKFSEALSMDPSSSALYLVRSRAYIAVELFEEALADVNKAFEFAERESATTWALKGHVEQALHNDKEAQDAFNRALQLDPSNPRARKGLELFVNQKNLNTLEIIADKPSVVETGKEHSSSSCLIPNFNGINACNTYSSSSSSNEEQQLFQQLRILGHGSYGVVDEVRELSTGSVYARKSIPAVIIGQDPRSIEIRVKNETEIMSRLRHNHISSVNMLFRTESSWTMLMLPVADCDLRYFLDELCVNSGFPIDYLRLLDPWFGCLTSALAYAHTEMVKHEDIKPNNILIRGHKVFLTDFGTAKDFSRLEESVTNNFAEQGTPVYWAPEPRAWGRAADVFALGCVFAEMLTVRQKRSLRDFRDYRHNPESDFGYAFRSNLPKLRQWLRKELKYRQQGHDVATTVLEQTLNMLATSPHGRSDAMRVKKNLRSEESLFCASCY